MARPTQAAVVEATASVVDKIDGAFDLVDRFFGVDSRNPKRAAPRDRSMRPEEAAQYQPKQVTDGKGATIIEAIDPDTGREIWVVRRGDDEMICNSLLLACRAKVMLDTGAA